MRLLLAAVAVASLLLPATAGTQQGDGGDDVPFVDFSCRARSWVAGTSQLCDGVLTYHDYVYDDYGADLGTTGSSTGTLSLPAGDQRYPEGEPANTADLVDLSLRVVDDRLEVVAELNALYEPDSTLLVLAIDTDADTSTGGGEWHGFGISSDGWEQVHVFTAADTLANLIGGSVRMPPGERWRLQAVTAQVEGPVMNVAFRGPDELARFFFRELSGPDEGAWFEDLQAAALASGDITAFGLEVDVADLTGRATRQLDEVGPGLHERVYTSDVTLPPGEGMSYEGIRGRGTGGPTGAFGQVFHYFGRYQPYGLYLPDGPGPHALGMIYHGSNQNHSQLVNLPGLQQQVGDDANRILAAPLARGVHGYGSDISERDLEDVEADVRAHYPVDTSQVIAAGYSQGGYVTFRQAALHPDRFAALISWVGFTGDDTNPVATDLVTAGAVGNMFDFVGNYRHIPAALIYGAADQLIPVTSSEALANEFRTRGNVYAFFMHPTGDHFQFALLDEWGKEAAYVAGRTTAVGPPRVTFRTADVLGDPDVGVRHDRAYWTSQIRARESVADHFAAEDAYVDVDLLTQGCGGETPIVEIRPGAGTEPIPWVSDEGVVVDSQPIPVSPHLSGTLSNVASLAVDTAATCLTGPVSYELTVDGPTTVRFSDGRALELPGAGAHRGELPAGPHQAVDRIAGADRIGTSVAVSARTGDAATVMIARADDYADALAAGPLAALRQAPLLLTGRDALDERVAEEIVRLGATEVVLVGGEAALSQQVEAAVRALGAEVSRLAGADRFATAAEVARAVAAVGGDTSVAYLVEGAHDDPARGWPDAVAAGALAARQGRPLLLATRDAVPAATLEALAELGTTTVTAVGGEAAITWRTLAAAADPDGDGDGQVALHRLAGASRYATSALVAERMLDHLATTEEVWLVTGRDWPDALTAGPAAAASGGLLLLVDGSVASAEEWLSAHRPVEALHLVGGQTVLAGPEPVAG